MNYKETLQDTAAERTPIPILPDIIYDDLQLSITGQQELVPVKAMVVNEDKDTIKELQLHDDTILTTLEELKAAGIRQIITKDGTIIKFKDMLNTATDNYANALLEQAKSEPFQMFHEPPKGE